MKAIVNKIVYIVGDKDAIVIGCDKDIIKADIASVVNGKPVTGIANCAFEGCKKLNL